MMGLSNQHQGYVRPIAPQGSIQHAGGRENTMNQTPEQISFRAKLWQEFVAKYQTVLVTSPEKFNEYCENFRERWVSGK